MRQMTDASRGARARKRHERSPGERPAHDDRQRGLGDGDAAADDQRARRGASAGGQRDRQLVDRGQATDEAVASPPLPVPQASAATRSASHERRYAKATMPLNAST